MTLFEELKWRGLVDNITSDDLIDEINNGKLTFYVGVDPTGDSLHIGHLIAVIINAKRLKDAGNKPIIIAGGGTGLIGDPKPNAERAMISKEEVKNNIESIRKQIAKILSDDEIEIINNADWLLEMNAIDYLRDYGKYFNINYMLSKDTVKRRLDIGITYTEFSYMLLQSIDFLKLYEMKNCTLQIGGQDQWGNITSGLELIRKVHGEGVKCYGMTTPLLLKSDGTKFGKTEGGKMVWLSKEKTSPYEMYQFFINTEDSLVITLLKKLTFLTKEEIEELELSLKSEPEKRVCQKTLAYEVVKFIHGEEDAKSAMETSEKVFSGEITDEMPTYKLDNTEMNIMDLMVLVGYAPSKSEARRLIMGGAVKINNQRVEDVNMLITDDLFKDNYFVLSKGKKNIMKITK